MKKISIFLFFIGISVLIGCAAWIGADSIWNSVLSIGINGLLILVLWQIFVIILLSWAWYCVCPNLGILRLIWARNLREAAATCLPFSQVGGIILSIRAVCFKGYRYIKNTKEFSVIQGISSNIVDITTEILGQILFIVLGITILLAGGYHTNLPDVNHFGMTINMKWVIIFSTFILFIISIPLIWTQRRGKAFFQKIINFLSKNIAQQWSDSVTTKADELQQSLDEIWAHPKRVIRSSLIHFIGWLGGGFGTWICYHFLGANINITEAISIEAMVCIALSVGFLIPASVGIQEGAYVIFGAIFGIDPHISFGLSILRRGRDLIIGIPVLFLWQLAEIKYLRKHPEEKEKLDLSSNENV